MEQDHTPHEDEIFSEDKEWLAHQKTQVETEEHIHKCIGQLCNLLSLAETNIAPEISHFGVYTDLADLYDLKYFSSITSSVPFTIVACYHDTVDTLYYDDASLLGVIELRNHYPATSLHKEKVSDKLANLITKSDIDFKDQKNFSKTFHLMSADKDFIRGQWDGKPLDLLADYPVLQLMIKDRFCVYKLHDSGFNTSQVSEFVNITQILLRILG